MKSSLANLIVGFVFLAAAFQASAAPVDVNFTLSGSAGDWTYDFSVTNNIGSTNNIYAVVVDLPSTSVAGSPPGWGVGLFAPVEWCYAANCGFLGVTNLALGDTLSGFMAHSTGAIR